MTLDFCKVKRTIYMNNKIERTPQQLDFWPDELTESLVKLFSSLDTNPLFSSKTEN